MRKRIVKTILIVFALIFSVASFTSLYAWYTNVDYVGSIDAETEGLSFYYTIGDSAEKNEKSYNIENLSFFDIDSANELKYFEGMSNVIALNITNNDDAPKKYSITYEATKRVSGARTSVAYPLGIISASAKLNTASANSISDLIPQDATNNDTTYTQTLNRELGGSLSEVIYLHLIGIQEIDTASNNDFLFDQSGNKISYSFKITIHAENVSNGPTIRE